MKYALIDAEKTHHTVSVLARMLGVSREGYYAWRRRGAQSARSADDQTLTTKIAAVHAASRQIYGAPQMHADLAAAGVRTSRKRVARLMRQAGLQGVHRRRRVSPTRRDRAAHLPPDLVGGDFTAQAPNRVWTADVTYIPTGQGWLYLAVVLDLYARRSAGPCPTNRKPHSWPTRSPWHFNTAGPFPASFIIPTRAVKPDSTGRRNTALMTLAADLPAPILADLLDLHIATAVAWTQHAAHDWAVYLAARDL